MLRKFIKQCVKLNINYNQYSTTIPRIYRPKKQQKHEDQQQLAEKNASPSPAVARIKLPVTESENPINLYKNVNNLEINWSDEFPKSIQTGKNLLKPINDPEIFQSIAENVAPNLKPTFNLAAYVNKSETLQQLIKLGVDLSKIEKRKGLPQFILKLNFDNDIKPRLLFLHHTIGINPDLFGWFITKNPLIFKENLEDIQIRLNYLQSKQFTPQQITTIIEKNPFWVMFKTQRIDQRLGFFQKTFKLDGDEIRALVTKQSKLITYNMKSINLISFSIREEMGFNNDEIKTLLLNMPKIWMLGKFIFYYFYY